MDVQYEAQYQQLEEQHWWFVARREAVADIIKQLQVPHTASILEIGCSGGPLQLALRDTGYRHLTGIDLSERAIDLARRRGLTDVAVMDGADLQFADASFDLLIASDVLEHIDDEDRALREWSRVLRPGGQIIIYVPAFQIMWSAHDEINHHYRRYTASSLRTALQRNGFSTERVSYWNSTLFTPAVAFRLAQRLLRSKAPAKVSGDLHVAGGAFNASLLALLRFENRLLRNMNLPLGISVFAIARKSA
jgi:SAM-dependent methyltransferase